MVRHGLAIFTYSGNNCIQTKLSPEDVKSLKVVSVRMDVNSLHSPSLAVVTSSKVRRVGLGEDKSIFERRVSGVEDDGGRLVFCWGSAITFLCLLL